MRPKAVAKKQKATARKTTMVKRTAAKRAAASESGFTQAAKVASTLERAIQVVEPEKLVASDSMAGHLKGSAQDMANWVKALQITDGNSLLQANAALASVTRLQRSAEERRLFFVKPLKEHVKRIDTLFRAIVEPLEEANGLLRDKIVAYREQLRKAAEAAQRKQVEAIVEAEQLKTEAQLAAEEGAKNEARMLRQDAQAAEEKALQLASAATGPSRLMTTGGTTVAARKRWTFQVIDAAAVPREYLGVNESALRKAVQSGLREIPGVHIFETEVLAVGGL